MYQDRTTQIRTSHGTGNQIFYTDYSYQKGLFAKHTTNLVNKIYYKYGYHQLVWAADKNTGLYTQINYDKAGNIPV